MPGDLPETPQLSQGPPPDHPQGLMDNPALVPLTPRMAIFYRESLENDGNKNNMWWPIIMFPKKNAITG